MRSVLSALLAVLISVPAIAQSLPQPEIVTQPAGSNSARAASTAYVDRSAHLLQIALAGKASLFNPAFTGVATFASRPTFGTAVPWDSANLDPSSLAPVFIGMTQPGALNTAFAKIPNPNVILASPGNRIAFCPVLSCFESSPLVHQRASLLVSAESQVDGEAEEQTLAVTTTIKTGRVKAWAPNTAFAVGDNVEFQDARNAVYRAVQAGTSAANGTGPSGTGDSIADGTVRWRWINAAAINGKVGIYNEVSAQAGGGKGWAQANNFEMRPGHVPSFNVNTEFDFNNYSGVDCLIGVANCNNLYLRSHGNKITSWINAEAPDTGNQVSYFGLWMHGSRLASDATIELNTTGLAGIRIGSFLPASYAQAGIVEQSTSPVGVQFSGTYGTAQARGTGWQISPDGSLTAKNVELVNGSVFERSPYVPTAANSPCATGQRSWDANFEYRCVAANTWKRTALSSW